MKSEETKTTNIAFNPIYLITAIVMIFISLLITKYLPGDYHYLWGYITSAFATPFFTHSFHILSDEELEALWKEEDNDV